MKKKLIIISIVLLLIGGGFFTFNKYKELNFKKELTISLQHKPHNIAKSKIENLTENELDMYKDSIVDILVLEIYDGFSNQNKKKLEDALSINDIINYTESDWRHEILNNSKKLPDLLQKVALIDETKKCKETNQSLGDKFSKFTQWSIDDLINYVNSGYNFYYTSAVENYEDASKISYEYCGGTEKIYENEKYVVLDAVYLALTDYSRENIKAQIKTIQAETYKQLTAAEQEIKELNEMMEYFELFGDTLKKYDDEILKLRSEYN